MKPRCGINFYDVESSAFKEAASTPEGKKPEMLHEENTRVLIVESPTKETKTYGPVSHVGDRDNDVSIIF